MDYDVWDPTAPGGIGGLLELTQNGQHNNYLYDGKGNVIAVTDTNQQVVAAYRYEPFGKLVSKSGTLDQPYMFSTKPYLSGIGMVKYDRRDYLTPLERWAERDPLGEIRRDNVELNLYQAMGNSAVNFIDPYGLLLAIKVGPIGITLDPFGLVPEDKTIDVGKCAKDAWKDFQEDNYQKRMDRMRPQIEQKAREFVQPYINEYTPGNGIPLDHQMIQIELMKDAFEKQRTRPKDYKEGCHELPY